MHTTYDEFLSSYINFNKFSATVIIDWDHVKTVLGWNSSGFVWKIVHFLNISCRVHFWITFNSSDTMTDKHVSKPIFIEKKSTKTWTIKVQVVSTGKF